MKPRCGWIAKSCLMLMMSGCGLALESIQQGVKNYRNSEVFHQGRHGDLSEEELEWAKTAWKYFENNWNRETGLVNMMDRYSVTTMWCTGDYLASLVAAHELDLIDKRKLDLKLSLLIGFLNQMGLFAGRVPNRLYDTKTGKMIDYSRQPQEVGWSAVEVGRLLAWLHVVAHRYPQYSEYIDKALLRWNFCDLIDRCGTLYSGAWVNGEIRLLQEGRLGYEEYAAHGFSLWGFDVHRAADLAPYRVVTVEGTDIYYDDRDPRVTGVLAPVVSLPSILLGLEFNWDRPDDRTSRDSRHTDPVMAQVAERIYRAQEARYENRRILTARTDHPSSKAPYFVYDSIFGAGYAWNTITESGEFRPELALVSTRAAFGLWALFKTPYTHLLLEGLCALSDSDRGWYEGRFERSGAYDKAISCTTNAVVLEALLYKEEGKLYRHSEGGPSFLELRLRDPFAHPKKCFPGRESCEVGHG